jgi:hypothetical protein
MRRGRSLALFAALTLGSALATFTVAEAQSRRQPHARPAPAKKGAKDAAAPAPTAEPMSPRNETAQAAPAATDGGAVESRTLDGGAHVFRFGEVEIEARLRSPQLVYFLRRVRAEFAAGDLGHRSFMRELSETRKDPNF